MTQLSREKLEEIKYRTETQGINAGYLPDEILAMVNRLLASEAQEPVADAVAWSHPNEERTCDIRLRRHDVKPGPLYAAPQPVAVPSELLGAMEEVLRISDRDHEAWRRVREGIAAYRAATQEPTK